jgi:site-specific DNA-methyltransferase (adenine-specific)
MSFSGAGFDLHNSDGIQFMRSLRSQSIDAIITDPPYGLDFQGESWDSFIPEWIAEARRVAKIVAFTTAPTTQWDYPRPDWVSCWYREAAQSRTVYGSFNHWSPILIYGGKPSFTVDSIKLHAIKHNSSDVEHPSPKPLALMRWLVLSMSTEGDTIFDPFMGSGSTGIACIELGRYFLGCEIKTEYFTIAEKRIRQARQSPSFYTKPSETTELSKQQELFKTEKEST